MQELVSREKVKANMCKDNETAEIKFYSAMEIMEE
jgi:hypothetical protein